MDYVDQGQGHFSIQQVQEFWYVRRFQRMPYEYRLFNVQGLKYIFQRRPCAVRNEMVLGAIQLSEDPTLRVQKFILTSSRTVYLQPKAPIASLVHTRAH